MISALAWVPRGAARATPLRQELTMEELELVRARAHEEASEHGVAAAAGAAGAAAAAAGAAGKKAKGAARAGAAAKSKASAAAMEEDDAVTPGLAAMPAEEDLMSDDDDASDAEDMHAQPADVFVLAANTEDDYSSLEVYCFNTDSGAMFVHHDVTLPAMPLSIAWMDYAGDAAAQTMMAQSSGRASAGPASGFVGSYAAIGTFKPDIEIWNLDVMDPLEPSLVLKGDEGAKPSRKGKGKASAPASSSSGHKDAVLGLAWNRTHRHMLASGSADNTVKIWDMDGGGRMLHTYTHHLSKVQSVAWNPVEASILAAASYDRTISVTDARTPESGRVARYALGADSESLLWNPYNPACMVASCDDGSVVMYDGRMPDRTVWNIRAHSAATTCVSMSVLAPGLMATSSLDKSIKLWDVLHEGAPVCVAQKVMSIGQIFTCSFLPQMPFLLAAGGSKGALALWDISVDGGEVTGGQGVAPAAEDAISSTAQRFVGREVPAVSAGFTAVRPRSDGQAATPARRAATAAV